MGLAPRTLVPIWLLRHRDRPTIPVFASLVMHPNGPVLIDSGVGLATPGHAPGHQSVLVEGDDGTRTIVCCQASWTVSSFGEGSLDDEGWDEATGAASVRKLRSLEPDRVLFSHDPETWRLALT